MVCALTNLLFYAIVFELKNLLLSASLRAPERFYRIVLLQLGSELNS